MAFRPPLLLRPPVRALDHMLEAVNQAADWGAKIVGLVPIGAMLARRDLWRKAYGTLDGFALHTSTFGGGSLACAAGLAAVRVFRETDVVANAEERGRQLSDGLRALAARYSIVREVRGQDLLMGMEFHPPPESIIGLLQGLLAGGASTFLVPSIEEIQRSLTATYVMTLLLQEHGIYTQVTRSNPRTLRIEPPLILTAEEATQFLRAVEECCREVESVFVTFDQMVAKAVLGQHGGESKPAAGDGAACAAATAEHAAGS